MGVAEDLVAWAESSRNRGAQADFARRVAVALQDEEEVTTWSLIDLRREFDARAVESGRWSSFVGTVANLAFIVPVGLAWLHLQGVFTQFHSAVRLAGKGEQINFLAYWTGAYDGKPFAYRGTRAGEVALQVLLAVIAVIAMQIAVGVLDASQSRRDRKLNNLITDASLRFAKKRAIRPEELAGEIRVAAEELERGLKNLTIAFDRTKELVNEVQGFTGEITASAALLKESSSTLAWTMQPLKDFGETAKTVEQVLGRAVESLGSAERAFSVGVKGNLDTMDTAKSMFVDGLAENINALGTARAGVEGAAMAVTKVGNDLSTAVRGAAGAVESATNGLSALVADSTGITSAVALTAREVREALGSVTELAGALGSAGSSAREAAASLASMVTSADSNQVRSYMMAIENVAVRMRESADSLVATVSHMSDQLQKWTDDGR